METVKLEIHVDEIKGQLNSKVIKALTKCGMTAEALTEGQTHGRNKIPPQRIVAGHGRRTAHRQSKPPA